MPIWETIENLAAYLPRDRIIALGKGEDLPEFAHGSTLFADISGFTPLTEAVVSRYGPRRGGEELTNHLNTVYDALIREVDGYDGSVIGFAGDAITTWFRDDDGTKALACAFRMQSTMTAFQSITLPDGAVYSLGMKVAVAAGRVRRFVVGDIEIQRSDLIAGDVLERLADAEHAAERGDVVCDGFTAEALTSAIIISERRPSETGIPVAVVERMPHPPEPLAVNDIPLEGLTAEKLRPWLIREIFERVVSGQGEFLTELRPAAAVFIRFVGIAFETDPDAPVKLNTYTCWLQRVIADLGGTLVQITIGDKGSFAYAAFGAPSANEDDTARALAAAIQVRDSPPQIREIAGDVQVGVTRGTMRTGAYGGLTRRTYGILGDDVNLSARLMQNAKPGQVLISEAAARRNQDRFDLLELPRITVKGKTEPIRIFELCSRVERQTVSFKADRYRIPMIGRRSELSQIRERFEQAKSGRGQLVSIVADAGVGKSRLIAEATRIADRSGFTGFSGECQSLARNTSFSAPDLKTEIPQMVKDTFRYRICDFGLVTLSQQHHINIRIGS